MRRTYLSAALLCLVLSVCCLPGSASSAPGQAAAQARSETVYAGQPAFTEDELLRFIKDLPSFRSWLRTSGEKAHPVMKGTKADFYLSPAARSWLEMRSWDPRRFCVIMGRSAAALVLETEGPESEKLYKDMPTVSESESALVLKHMGELLKAGNDTPQVKK